MLYFDIKNTEVYQSLKLHPNWMVEIGAANYKQVWEEHQAIWTMLIYDILPKGYRAYEVESYFYNKKKDCIELTLARVELIGGKWIYHRNIYHPDYSSLIRATLRIFKEQKIYNFITKKENLMNNKENNKEMIYNDCNMPLPIFTIMQKKMYQGAKVETFASVTELEKPPKLFWGKRKINKLNLAGKKLLPASSRTYSMTGSFRHLMFEHGLEGDPNFQTEKRLYLNFNIDGVDYLISGEFDCIHIPTKTMYDYKEVAAGKYVAEQGLGKWKDNPKKWKSYHAQQNIYRYMINHSNCKEAIKNNKGEYELVPLQNRVLVDHMYLCPVIRDYQSKKFQMPYLPGSMFAPAVKVPMWKDEEIISYISDKIRYLRDNFNESINKIKECTMEERYQDPDLYVVQQRKMGSKSKFTTVKGTAKNESEDDAKNIISKRIANHIAKKEPIPEYKIDHRKSTPKKCLSYCELSQLGLCNWYKEHQHEFEGSDGA